MGGKAFTDVTPVAREEIPKLVEKYMRVMGHPAYGLLGSTGKRDFSGDVDLAVTDRVYNYDAALTVLQEWLGAENVSAQGRNLNQIYTRYNRKGVSHQVDIMIGNVELLQFTHFAPHSEVSKYGGSHRTELIKAVAKVNSPHLAYNGKQLVARVGYTLHHDKGLTFSARWCPPRKDGTGFTVKMVEVSDYSLFQKTFPGIPTITHQTNIRPPEIAYVLFETTNDRGLNSYERVCERIKELARYDDLRDLIWSLYTQRLDEIKLAHPERLI